MAKPVFVALDLDNEEKLKQILAKLGAPKDTYIKVGMELFFNSGSNLVRKLADQGYKIFFRFKNA